jgi:hypothetical protein
LEIRRMVSPLAGELGTSDEQLDRYRAFDRAAFAWEGLPMRLEPTTVALPLA